jgi:hypothetical protein
MVDRSDATLTAGFALVAKQLPVGSEPQLTGLRRHQFFPGCYLPVDRADQ